MERQTVLRLASMCLIANLFVTPLAFAQTSMQNQIPESLTTSQLGTSFDCSRSGQGVHSFVCGDRELRIADLRQMQVYYALRHAAPDRQVEFRAEFINRIQSLSRSCTGETVRASGNQKSCLSRGLNEMRVFWMTQLVQISNSFALEDAYSEMKQLIYAQGTLQSLGFLPRSANVDGVYGNMTREALLNFQKDNAIATSGFLSNATASALFRSLSQNSNAPSQQTRSSREAAQRGTNPSATDPIVAARQRQVQSRIELQQYRSREKNLLEKILNYTTTGLEEGLFLEISSIERILIQQQGFAEGTYSEIFSEYWVSGLNGAHHCVLTRVRLGMNEGPNLREMLRGGTASFGNQIDVREFNEQGFRIQTLFDDANNGGQYFSVGDERRELLTSVRANVPVIDRIRRAWQLAFRECPGKRSAF